tara:strand:+ start:174 stop:362 length:189 start_codon:yes stop_codon:yes gene_type:complete
MGKTKCVILGHNTELVYTEPEARKLSDGRKITREWIDHIVCLRCNKKWFPPSDEEIKRNLNR